jgi:oxygen-independent coproporphyrinogen-3 oxidase
LFGDYLGIGAGAHGKLSFELPQRILRTVKPKQPREYLEQVRRAGSDAGSTSDAAANLNSDAGASSSTGTSASSRAGASIGESSLILAKDLPFEFMLNALRLNEGFTVRDYRRRTGLEMASVEGKLAEGEARGLLMSRADNWRPTELGRRFLNDLQASFLA